MSAWKIAEMSNIAAKLKDSLGLSRRAYILCACGAVALSFSYLPLATKLYRAATRLGELEAELQTQRGVVAISDKSDTKIEVMPRNEVPLAIAELTTKGRNLGLSFIFIASEKLRETSRSESRRQSVTFVVESEYRSLGEFLAYVEEFPRTIVDVESLSIRPTGDDPSELNVGLVLNLYVEI